jgi:hypothetical protein
MSITGTLIFLLTLAFGATAAPPLTVASNAMTPFDVVLAASSESVAISGKIHVSTAVQDQGESTILQLHVNLADTSGVGQTTGAVFHFTSNLTASQEIPAEVFGSEEASVDYFIGMAGKLAKGDTAANLSNLQKMLLRLKFDAARRLVAVEVAPFDLAPCSEE